LHLIRLASEIAPDVPGVQMQLGELLLKMALRDDALRYMALAVTLDPTLSRKVVAKLRDQLFSAEQILDALPRSPDVLVALRAPFAEDRAEERYLEALEASLGTPEGRRSTGVLGSYGSACLALGRPDRLHDRMGELGEIADSEAEALRWYQMARASTALGVPSRALVEAAAALRASRSSPSLAEGVGDVALSTADPELAVTGYRQALALVARASGDPTVRARLYAKIGRAEEAGGDIDRAYDSYGMALKLDPAQPLARARVSAMEDAAGVKKDSGSR
jgi:tetratricopeptide (TPR) repeat protein